MKRISPLLLVWTTVLFGAEPCKKSFRQLAMEAFIRKHGSGPVYYATYREPEVVQNTDGSYDIFVSASAMGPAQKIHFEPVDPADPNKGFNVTRTTPSTGAVEVRFSPTPPRSFDIIRQENAARYYEQNKAAIDERNRIKEEEDKKKGRQWVLDRFLAFHKITPERQAECRALVEKTVDPANPDVLDRLVVEYAIATRPTAVESVLAGAKERGHTREQLTKFLTGQDKDNDTVANEVHQAYADTVGSIRAIRANGFKELADSLTEQILLRFP